jgi:hypothetical protein
MTLALTILVAWLALDAVICILWAYMHGGGTR